jgi:hypothetical protein
MNLFPPEHKHKHKIYMQNQIVVHNQSVQDITAMAQAITKSGLFGIKTADQAVALMLVAQSEGRHPASVASEFDIIQGRPALKSQAALARFQAAGGKIQWVERTDSKASAKFSHAQGGELLVEWTIEQARDAGLTSKQTWKQYARAMLSARVVAEGVRACYPACLNGVYLTEEVQDFDAKPPKAQVTIIESKQEEPVAMLPEPPKEIIVETEPVQGEVIEWEGDWFTPEVKATLADNAQVNAFLIGKNKIKEGQTWRDITDKEYQKRINTGLSRFVEAVEKASK